MKKICITLVLSLLLSLGLATAATATSSWVLTHRNWYNITTANGSGSTVELSAANKRYSQLCINLSDKTKTVTLSLHKKRT